MQHSVGYTILFAGVVCVVCAVFVSTSAVSLADLQTANAELDKRRNVLMAAGLADSSEGLREENVNELFEPVKTVVIDLETGEQVPEVDPATYGQQKAKSDPEQSREAPEN